MTIKNILNSEHDDVDEQEKRELILQLINQLKQLQGEKLANTLVSVANRKTFINHTETISQYIKHFETVEKLSDSQFKFFRRINKSFVQWHCRFVVNKWAFGEIIIIHNPKDVRIGKRIEMIFNEDEFEVYPKYDKFFQKYNVCKMVRELYQPLSNIVRIQFDDPKEILYILNEISLRLEEQ